jgi:hypothetical protein
VEISLSPTKLQKRIEELTGSSMAGHDGNQTRDSGVVLKEIFEKIGLLRKFPADFP